MVAFGAPQTRHHLLIPGSHFPPLPSPFSHEAASSGPRELGSWFLFAGREHLAAHQAYFTICSGTPPPRSPKKLIQTYPSSGFL